MQDGRKHGCVATGFAGVGSQADGHIFFSDHSFEELEHMQRMPGANQKIIRGVRRQRNAQSLWARQKVAHTAAAQFSQASKACGTTGWLTCLSFCGTWRLSCRSHRTSPAEPGTAQAWYVPDTSSGALVDIW